ncbi:MAG: BatD family protein [Elusimicrobia bacterium]|nr:BatD family protein [Candidatus Liberimonas magnetica]
MKSILKLILFLLISCIPCLADQGSVLIQNSTDKNKISIGDNLNLKVNLTFPQTFTVDLPEKLPEIKGWDIRDFKKEIQNKESKQQVNLIYTLATFTTGEVLIPEITFKFKDSQGKENEIKTQSIKVEVESLLLKEGDKGDIIDIKPPFYLKIPLAAYFLWIFITASLAAGFLLWYKNYQKRNKLILPVSNEPKIPPHITALEELEKLKNSGLLKEGRIKEFYIALTDILRDFLSATYQIETRDRTTSEIYSDLRRKITDKKTLANIKGFFELCDLVKFAKYRPDEKTCMDDLETGVKIVKNQTT